MHSAIALASQVSTLTSAAVAASGSAAATGSAIGSYVTSTLPSVVASILPSGITTTVPMQAAVITLPPALELTAAFTGGLSSALAGVKSKFDVFGVATIAVAGGLGGGIIRDVLLQRHGIYALSNPSVLIAVFAAAVVAMFFSGAADKLQTPRFLIDALSLGLFAVAGADKALLAGLTAVPAIMLGTITSVGGGMLRDVLRNKTPEVLQPGTLYGIAAVAGAGLYVLLIDWLHVVKIFALLACVVVIMALRIVSVWRGWHAPSPRDLTPVVAGFIRPSTEDEWHEPTAVEDESEDPTPTELIAPESPTPVDLVAPDTEPPEV
jgi:uncharacterized membrane protein YeiH